MSHSKGKPTSAEILLITFFHIIGKIGKHIILFLGRFVKREIVLQAQWIGHTYTSMRRTNIHPIIAIILLTVVAICVLLVWAVLRAIFIPDQSH